MTAKQFSPESEARIRELWTRFPEENAGKALTLPALWMAHNEFGHVDEEVIDLIADRLRVTAAHVKGVATFYTMYNKRKVGKYHLQVCTNIGCMLEGGYEVFNHCKKRLGVDHKGTTSDGQITLSEVECLAACGFGPVAQIDEYKAPDVPLYFENLTIEKVDKIIDALEQGRIPAELGV